MTLTAGQTFTRKRSFRRPTSNYGKAYQSKVWWLVGVQNLNGDEIAAHGTEFIQIEEIVETQTVGPVAIYRQWVVDPDGADVEN